MAATTPLLFRALHHLAKSGFEPEADSAFVLSRATNWCEPLARGTRHLGFRFARSRLEYSVKVGCAQRVGWLIDRGGVEARVWDGEGGAPRWKLALFDKPPIRGEMFTVGGAVHFVEWPTSMQHDIAHEMLVSKVGGSPHNGFVMPLPGLESGFGPQIEGPLAAWRAANPGALVANVNSRGDLTDADFAHLAGIKALRMNNCRGPALTDAAFAHLGGLHTLQMSWCSPAITDAAFVHLRGLRSLWITGNDQPAITDAAFLHLRGIQMLDMSFCAQGTITGATLGQLRGVRLLVMRGCSPAAIAAASVLGLPVVQ